MRHNPTPKTHNHRMNLRLPGPLGLKRTRDMFIRILANFDFKDLKSTINLNLISSLPPNNWDISNMWALTSSGEEEWEFLKDGLKMLPSSVSSGSSSAAGWRRGALMAILPSSWRSLTKHTNNKTCIPYSTWSTDDVYDGQNMSHDTWCYN